MERRSTSSPNARKEYWGAIFCRRRSRRCCIPILSNVFGLALTRFLIVGVGLNGVGKRPGEKLPVVTVSLRAFLTCGKIPNPMCQRFFLMALPLRAEIGSSYPIF